MREYPTLTELRSTIDGFRRVPPEDQDARQIILDLCDKADKHLITHFPTTTCVACAPHDECRDIRWVRAIFAPDRQTS